MKSIKKTASSRVEPFVPRVRRHDKAPPSRDDGEIQEDTVHHSSISMGRALALAAALLLPAGAARADPPEETLQRLQMALESLADPAQVRAYTLTTVAHHEKPNGKDAHDEKIVARISVTGKDQTESELLELFHDGEPVSEEEQRKAQQDRDKKREDEGNEGFELEFKGPFGEDRQHYTFGETRQAGGLLVATIQPAAGATVDGLSTGSMAWDPQTLDPVWIEFTPVENPQFVQALTNRLEFGRFSGVLVMKRLVTDGQGGIPGMKRVFHMEVTTSDVQPAP